MLISHVLITPDGFRVHSVAAVRIFVLAIAWLLIRWLVQLPFFIPGTTIMALMLPVLVLGVSVRLQEPGRWMLSCVALVGVACFVMVAHEPLRTSSIMEAIDVGLQGVLSMWAARVAVSAIVANFRISRAAGAVFGRVSSQSAPPR